MHSTARASHLTTIVDATTRTKMLKQKCRNIFFLGRDRGVIGRFFSQLSEERNSCYFLRGLFLHKKN